MTMKFEKILGELFLAASKVGERHFALFQNIGTYATEVSTWILDALLAAAYLKWFHPWRILLEEVTAFLIQL